MQCFPVIENMSEWLCCEWIFFVFISYLGIMGNLFSFCPAEINVTILYSFRFKRNHNFIEIFVIKWWNIIKKDRFYKILKANCWVLCIFKIKHSYIVGDLPCIPTNWLYSLSPFINVVYKQDTTMNCISLASW